MSRTRNLGTHAEAGVVTRDAEASVADREVYEQLRSYLQLQSRGESPGSTLVSAWDRFYVMFSAKLKPALRKWGLNDSDRDDCLQEIWVAVIAAILRHDYDAERSRLSTWLLKVAQNKAIDVLRRRRKASASLSIEIDIPARASFEPDAAWDHHHIRSRLDEALKQLMTRVSPLTYRVFCLRAIERRPGVEVAVH